MRTAIYALMVAVLLSGCAATTWRPDTQANWPPTGQQQTEVTWSDYRPGLKDDVDKAGVKKDCPKLDALMSEAFETDTSDRLALTYINRWGDHNHCVEFEEKPGEM